MSNTIFSKIVLGEIPCDKVFEDDDHLAFLDIRPLSEGHTLVIPKKGYVDIFDMPSDEFGEFMEFVRFVALGVKKAVKCEGVNVGINNGAASGQEVMHLHVHVSPRNSGDGFKAWTRPENTADLEAVAENIAKHL